MLYMTITVKLHNYCAVVYADMDRSVTSHCIQRHRKLCTKVVIVVTSYTNSCFTPYNYIEIIEIHRIDQYFGGDIITPSLPSIPSIPISMSACSVQL